MAKSGFKAMRDLLSSILARIVYEGGKAGITTALGTAAAGAGAVTIGPAGAIGAIALYLGIVGSQRWREAKDDEERLAILRRWIYEAIHKEEDILKELDAYLPDAEVDHKVILERLKRLGNVTYSIKTQQDTMEGKIDEVRRLIYERLGREGHLLEEFGTELTKRLEDSILILGEELRGQIEDIKSWVDNKVGPSIKQHIVNRDQSQSIQIGMLIVEGDAHFVEPPKAGQKHQESKKKTQIKSDLPPTSIGKSTRGESNPEYWEEDEDGTVPVEAIHTATKRLKGEVFAIELLTRPVEIQRDQDGRFTVIIDRRDVTRAVITNRGKKVLCQRYVEADKQKKARLQEEDIKLQDFLLGRSSSDRFKLDLPELGIPLRWASGGVMSIVTRTVGNRREKWTPFFFRDINPWGWNIALGSCERSFDNAWTCKGPIEKELNDPREFLHREFLEETLILRGTPESRHPVQFKKFYFDDLLADQQCKKCKDFAKAHIEYRRQEDGLFFEMGAKPKGGFEPDCVKVHEVFDTMTDIVIIDRKGKRHSHHKVVVTFNLLELGIEVVRIYEYPIDESDYFLDGELLIHSDGKTELLRMPVALISHDALQRSFAPGNFRPRYTNDIQPSFIGDSIHSGEIKVFNWDIRQRLQRMNSSTTPEAERKRYQEWYRRYGPDPENADGTPATACEDRPSEPPTRILTAKETFNYEKIPTCFIPGTAKTLCFYFARMRK